MVWRDTFAQALLDLRFQSIIQRHAVSQYHKERHIILAARQFHPDDQAIEHLRDSFHDAVNLAAAHPDTLPVNRGIGTAIDDRATPVSNHDPVAVPPYPRVHLEIALLVALPFWIVPEVNGHRWHRLRNHQFSHLVNQWPPLLIKGLHLRS